MQKKLYLCCGKADKIVLKNAEKADKIVLKNAEKADKIY